MNSKPFDPELRKAADEFKAICQKYDIAGFALFVSPTHSEFVNYLSPSWSVCRIEGPGILRFRSKRSDFPTDAAQRHATDSTVHMLTSVIEWSRQVNTNMTSVIMHLRRHMQILWKAWNEVPDSIPEDTL